MLNQLPIAIRLDGGSQWLPRQGLNHPLTTAVQRPLGELLMEVGKLAEAHQLLRSAHDRLLSRFGPDHPEVAASWHQLGRVAWEQDRQDEADEALQRSLQLRRRGNELDRHVAVLCELARVRMARGVKIEQRRRRRDGAG